MDLVPAEFDLGQLTTEDFRQAIESDKPVVIMVSVGAVEPHGPHLGLATDIVISQAAAARAAKLLQKDDIISYVGPPIPYAVTECAREFRGAISVSAKTLAAYLSEVAESFLSNGVSHVCLVCNHLEPENYQAVLQALEGLDNGKASVACPLEKRWARTLSDEFKSGACHAGQYETSIALAAAPQTVKSEVAESLPDVPVSLSEKLNAGVSDFVEMGLKDAYAGSPAEASASEGEESLNFLAEMIRTTINESLSG